MVALGRKEAWRKIRKGGSISVSFAGAITSDCKPHRFDVIISRVPMTRKFNATFWSDHFRVVAIGISAGQALSFVRREYQHGLSLRSRCDMSIMPAVLAAPGGNRYLTLPPER